MGSIVKKDFGTTNKGEAANLYELSNDKIRVVVSDFGALLTNLFVKDKDDCEKDVVWGYKTIGEYEKNGFFFGGTIGRNANRIGNAKVVIDDKEYILDKNDGNNNLHSGFNGYHSRMWTVDNIIENDEKTSITFALNSKDMDQGFPGNATIKVTYEIVGARLNINYSAVSDQKTVFKLTNHSYFNLEGQDSENVLKHKVFIDADDFTPVDDALIPTGKLYAVKNTDMDFTKVRYINNYYDHNYCLNNTGSYRKVASMRSELSGIKMNVYTDLDGIQFYTSGSLDSKDSKNGKGYKKGSAACFETQYYPDSCNNKNFKTCIFDANEKFETTTSYEFVTE